MVPGTPNSGLVVRVQDLYTPESPFIVPNQSLRVVGSVERFDAVSGIAVLTGGKSSLHLDLQHLRELPLRVGSLFEFCRGARDKSPPSASHTQSSSGSKRGWERHARR